MIIRTVALPLLTGGALAVLVAYVYTRRAKRPDLIGDLIFDRDPLGVPETVSEALKRAPEDVNVRSEAEAIAVAGQWTGDSLESPEPPVDLLAGRVSRFEAPGVGIAEIFRVDMDVQHAGPLERKPSQALGADPVAAIGNPRFLADRFEDIAERPTEPVVELGTEGASAVGVNLSPRGRPE